MHFPKALIKTLSVSALLLGASSAIAQEQSNNVKPIVTENFEGDDPTLMLGGQINFSVDKSNWLVYAAEGKLFMQNRLEPQSVHFDDISWVHYPDTPTLSTTDDAVISVKIEAKNEGRGGAGILVGSGTNGAYLMFSIDNAGRYHIFQKQGRTANTVHSAAHEAIKIGAANDVAFAPRGANIVFFVNGIEVMQVPNTVQRQNGRQSTGLTGIGLAAFGVGTYSFDDVEITQAN